MHVAVRKKAFLPEKKNNKYHLKCVVLFCQSHRHSLVLFSSILLLPFFVSIKVDRLVSCIFIANNMFSRIFDNAMNISKKAASTTDHSELSERKRNPQSICPRKYLMSGIIAICEIYLVHSLFQFNIEKLCRHSLNQPLETNGHRGY